jgi:hypothetical protein
MHVWMDGREDITDAAAAWHSGVGSSVGALSHRHSNWRCTGCRDPDGRQQSRRMRATAGGSGRKQQHAVNATYTRFVMRRATMTAKPRS